jgi:alpha-ketoglutarate-dependent taurine dioxygenase
MTACDQRARQVDSFFREASSDAYRHEWSKAGQVLFIDNRRALHARSAISENEEHRLLRRITFDTQAIQ